MVLPLIESSSAIEQRIEKAIDHFVGKGSKAVRNFFSEDVKGFLEEVQSFDEELRANPETYITTRNIFRAKCNRIIEVGEEVVKSVKNRQIGKIIKRQFRELLAPCYKENPFIMRGLQKPRGYPGDYMMMEMGYKRETSQTGGFAGELDLYFFDRYNCIVCRKEKIKNYLREAIQKSTRKAIRVFTLGGGSSREWAELDQELSGNNRKRVLLTYLDHDEEALRFSKNRLGVLKTPNLVEYCNESLLRFRDSSEWHERAGSFDFVYAMGIADYFPDKLLCEISHRAMELVSPGGQFVIAHKDKERFFFPLLDWICDWNFVHRGETEFLALIGKARKGLNGAFEVKIDREKTGEIIFLIVTRKKKGIAS